MKRKIGLLVVICFGLLATAISGILAQSEEDDSALREKIARVAQSALVQVKYEFQKDPEEGLPEDDYTIRNHISNKTTQDGAGILLLEPAGTVLVYDSAMERKYIKKITVIDSAGNEYEAEPKSFLLDHPAAFLNIKGEQKPQGGIKFVEAGELNTARKLYTAYCFENDQEWFIGVTPMKLLIHTPLSTTSETKPWFGVFSSGTSYPSSNHYSRIITILFDDQGQAIGCPLEGRMETDGNRYGWKGTDLVTKPTITVESFDQKTEAMKKKYADHILEAKFLFRQPEKEKGSEYSSYARVTRSYSYDEDDEGNLDITEKKLYGLVIDRKRLFIPRDLPKELVNRIEKIEVTINNAKHPAKYLGIYEDFEGMLIELENANVITEPMNIYQTARPEHGRAFMTLKIRDKFDQRYEKVRHGRFMSIVKGYKNRLQHVPVHCDKPGTFGITFKGEPIGVLLSIKRELADRMTGGGRGYSYGGYYGYRGRGDARFYFFDELAKYFTEPMGFFDKKLIPLSDREMKRIIWLGVKFQPLTKELAEQLECQKVTREGKLGLMVSHTYEDSPAAQAGLELNDILIKLQEEGKDNPIELKSAESSDPYAEMYSRWSEFEQFPGFMSSGMRPWPSANDYLIQILTRIGEGKKITLTYWRDGKELTKDFVLAKAPYDFESAKKHKDETTGLTVRQLTYEVRHAWRLAKDYQAVVVSKVEEGSKAAIGGIKPFELITKIENQNIGSIDEFKKIIESLVKDETKQKARFTIEKMGKSRFVDVELKKK